MTTLEKRVIAAKGDDEITAEPDVESEPAHEPRLFYEDIRSACQFALHLEDPFIRGENRFNGDFSIGDTVGYAAHRFRRRWRWYGDLAQPQDVHFKTAAKLGTPEHVPVALIVDSPWLPGWAGIDTRDYFLYPEKWLEINQKLLTRFPSAVWLPGFWVEFGMAAEPSAFGAKIRFFTQGPDFGQQRGVLQQLTVFVLPS